MPRRSFPRGRDAGLGFFWQDKNPLLDQGDQSEPPGFQNSGPVLWLYGKDGTVKIEPSKGRNLFGDLPFSEGKVDLDARGSATDW